MRVLFLPLTVIAVLTVGLAARPSQATANFSGQWELVAAKPARPGYDQFWFGTEAKVTHDGAKLEVVRVAPDPTREARFDVGGRREPQRLHGRRPAHREGLTRDVKGHITAHQHRHHDTGRQALAVEYPALVARERRHADDRRHGDLRDRELPQCPHDTDV